MIVIKHKVLKRITVSRLLLFCLLVPIITTFTILHYQKKQIKKEVKSQIIAKIDKEKLTLLKFTKTEAKNQLKWEHAHEFEFNGQMYDIVETESKGNIIYYWCWPDNKETQLNKQLDKLLTFALGNDSNDNDNKKKLANFLKSLYSIETESLISYNFKVEKVQDFYRNNYFNIYYSPPSPPPKLI
jgi:hypothetical protein